MDKKELAGADWWRPTVEGWIGAVANGVMQQQWADIIQMLDEQTAASVGEVLGIPFVEL